MEELKELDCAFLSSSNREILPIAQIDNIFFEKEKIKPLINLFKDYTSKF